MCGPTTGYGHSTGGRFGTEAYQAKWFNGDAAGCRLNRPIYRITRLHRHATSSYRPDRGRSVHQQHTNIGRFRRRILCTAGHRWWCENHLNTNARLAQHHRTHGRSRQHSNSLAIGTTAKCMPLFTVTASCGRRCCCCCHAVSGCVIHRQWFIRANTRHNQWGFIQTAALRKYRWSQSYDLISCLVCLVLVECVCVWSRIRAAARRKKYLLHIIAMQNTQYNNEQSVCHWIPCELMCRSSLITYSDVANIFQLDLYRISFRTLEFFSLLCKCETEIYGAPY